MTAQTVVWPNGFDVVAVRKDTGETVDLAEHIEGNAVMSPKPVQDHNIFRKIEIVTGPVPTYFSHGERTEDIRAFHFARGRLETHLIGVVPYRASYPKFKPESCVTAMRVNVAVANYCTRARSTHRDDRADIWIGELTDKFNDPDVVSVGFWPHVMVVRDMENNDLDHEKCGDGYMIEVSPSAADIDQYLPIRGYWPANVREQ